MSRQFVYYDDFQLGESGEKGDYLVGYKLFRGILIYTGSFKGENVRRNIDGTICARPGLKPTPLTGLPAGLIRGFGSTQFPTKTGWCIVGTTVYLFDLDAGGAVIPCTGSLASTPTAVVVGIQSGPTNVYITSQGDQTYVIDLNAATVTAMANSPGGAVIGIYDDLLCVANLGGVNTNRIAFSDPFAPGGTPQFPWPVALNYIDIGDAWPITAFAWQRTRALIGKQNAWYQLTGVPNTNAVLRLVLESYGPLKQGHSLMTQQGLVWYVPIFSDCPTEFNGTAEAQLRQLRFANRNYVEQEFPPAFGASPLVQLPDLAFIAGHAVTGGADRLCELHNGAWAYQQFGVPTSGFIASGPNGLYICDGGSAGEPANFFVYDVELDRPVKSTDGSAMFGDNSALAVPTTVTLPEWESRDGSDCEISYVLVGFKKWDTGSAETNHLDVTVTSMRQRDLAGDELGGQSNTQSWDEPPSATEFDGQYQEMAFFPAGLSTGNGFRITLSNLRGVAIQKIQVILDLEDTVS